MESAIIASGLQDMKEEASFDRIETQARLSNQISNLVLDSKGSPNFIGMSQALLSTN
jgi:hypothetical protein